jgi:hypothetical protein
VVTWRGELTEPPAATEAPAPAPATDLDDDLLAGLAQGAALESPEAQRARHETRAAQAARARVQASEPPDEPPPRSRFDWQLWLVNFGRALIPGD